MVRTSFSQGQGTPPESTEDSGHPFRDTEKGPECHLQAGRKMKVVLEENQEHLAVHQIPFQRCPAGPASLKGFLQQTFLGGFLREATWDWPWTSIGRTGNSQGSTCRSHTVEHAPKAMESTWRDTGNRSPAGGSLMSLTLATLQLLPSSRPLSVSQDHPQGPPMSGFLSWSVGSTPRLGAHI